MESFAIATVVHFPGGQKEGVDIITLSGTQQIECRFSGSEVSLNRPADVIGIEVAGGIFRVGGSSDDLSTAFWRSYGRLGRN